MESGLNDLNGGEDELNKLHLSLPQNPPACQNADTKPDTATHQDLLILSFLGGTICVSLVEGL